MSATERLLALKVDADTLRGTRIGVPALTAVMSRHGVDATFLFSVGPDHTGRALRRIARPGFASKVARTSVLAHYGIVTLLYGTLLPGPHIGRACKSEMRSVRAAGFEVGLHCYDHVEWQDFVAQREGQWAQQQMHLGIEAFAEVFGEAPHVHGAAGWQMHAAAFETEVAAAMTYASDTRGIGPFLPVIDGAVVRCPQLPTTLPTLDELIGVDGCTPAAAAERLLSMTREPKPGGHVYTLHAELEGMRLRPLLETLLQGWRAQGYEIVAMKALLQRLDQATLPHHRIEAASIPGRSGLVMTQGAPVRTAAFDGPIGGAKGPP